jgi:hypothetical protein
MQVASGSIWGECHLTTAGGHSPHFQQVPLDAGQHAPCTTTGNMHPAPYNSTKTLCPLITLLLTLPSPGWQEPPTHCPPSSGAPPHPRLAAEAEGPHADHWQSALGHEGAAHLIATPSACIPRKTANMGGLQTVGPPVALPCTIKHTAHAGKEHPAPQLVLPCIQFNMHGAMVQLLSTV